MLFSVITTINEPTSCVSQLTNKHKQLGLGPVIIVGDSKGPQHYNLPHTKLLTYAQQKKLFSKLSNLIPTNHYARKNIGYLYAIRSGATSLYETDDDNEPNSNWHPRVLEITAPQMISSDKLWVNVYKHFTDANIWPRGLPIEASNTRGEALSSMHQQIDAPIQQGLANVSPDVDAVWRLINEGNFFFRDNHMNAVTVPKGVWSPFNSQSTWWFPVAFPLLYIPSFCPFRMCDIWRSFIAQRCLWELDYNLVFHPPEVDQIRNRHDNIEDLKGEIQGMQFNTSIVSTLAGLDLKSGISNLPENVFKCYRALIAAGFLKKTELRPLGTWLEEIYKGGIT